MPFAFCDLPFDLFFVVSDPSPVTLRLVKAPERDTLSPRERAICVVGRGCPSRKFGAYSSVMSDK